MLSVWEVRDLATLMQRSGIAQIELEVPGQRLSLQVSAAAATAGAAGAPVIALSRIVQAPSMGLFRHTHPDGLFAPCDVGDLVVASQIIGFIQIDRMLLSVCSPASGRVTRIVAADGELVGYGDPLFTIDC